MKLKLKQIESLFDVQKKVFKLIYDKKNVIVASLTGNRKTLAFVLPILQRIYDNKLIVDKQSIPLIMVMSPTRQLSVQKGREFSDLSSKEFNLKTVLIYGRVSMEAQISKLKSGCDIVVGTPGIIMDMIVKVNNIQTIILDEADKMLDMGFEESITDIYNKIIESS